jgi:GDPmannose 4,6-dehydratase
MPTALITGISGQDGSYLAELLLEKGYRIVGVTRSLLATDFSRISAIRQRIELVEWDMLDQGAIESIVRTVRPDEVYNLAARASSSQMYVGPVLSGEVNGLAVARILEAIRMVDKGIRFCQASTSELFGKPAESPQSEATPFHPRSPYGVSKLYGHWITVNYREVHGLFACSGILFNHESPRRGEEYVTRKITRAAARIKAGQEQSLTLWDLDARRDWGFAPDYVRGLWLTLQAAAADDYVFATGESHSVREFCKLAFERVGLHFGDYVRIDPEGRRQSEPVPLVGDARKARHLLGWKPSVTFEELVRSMTDADLECVAARAP